MRSVHTKYPAYNIKCSSQKRRKRGITPQGEPWRKNKRLRVCLLFMQMLYIKFQHSSSNHLLPTIMHFYRIKNLKIGYVQKSKKVTKVKLIMPKSHLYLQTITKKAAKSQFDRYKTVWGVAQTKYPSVVEFPSWKRGNNSARRTTMEKRKKYGSA